MGKYKCNICDQISTAEEWNENTIEKLGGPIDNVEDGADFMICPKCNKQIDYREYEKVES